MLVLFLCLLAARAEADETEIFSPVASYLFPEAAGAGGGEVFSPVVSYLFPEAPGLAGEEVASPVVSYLFPELPDDPGLRLATYESARVSYFFNVAAHAGPVTLGGVVVDVRELPLPGATVTVRAFDTGRTVISGTDGRYLLPDQPGGVYELVASKPGYRSDRRVVALTPQTARQDFALLPPLPAPPVEPAGPGERVPERIPVRGAGTSRLLVFDGTGFSSSLGGRADLPTVVLTHGWQRCEDETADRNTAGANSWPLAFAREMHRQGITVNNLNIVAWDWYDAARPCLLGPATPPPEGVTPDQGLALGQALHATLGSGYQQAIQFIGHSLGTLVNSYAVDYVHGNARGNQPKASPPWNPAFTQVTLFDEAAMAKLIAKETLLEFFSELADSGDLAQAILAYLLEASRWKDPVPGSFAYLDNYFAAVGRYHAEGANVMLQRRLYDGVLDSQNLVAGFVPLVVKAHGYPIDWYLGTMKPPFKDVPGWQQSVPWSVLSPQYEFPPSGDWRVAEGVAWRQSWASADEYVLEPANPGEGAVPPLAVALLGSVNKVILQSLRDLPENAVALAKALASGSYQWVDGQFDQFSAWAAGKIKKVGDASLELVDDAGETVSDGVDWVTGLAKEGRAGVMDFAGRVRLRLELRTGPPPPGPRLQDDPPADNTPAHLWLPVNVPADAQWLTFRFRVEGDGADDLLVFGVDGTNRFALATEFIAREATEQSGLIAVGDVAGQTAELFFGLVGGTSTNCAATVEGIQFHGFSAPQLEISQTAGITLLSWPSTAVGWDLETAPALGTTNWTAVPQPAAVFGGRYWLTNTWPEAARFFRLRQRF